MAEEKPKISSLEETYGYEKPEETEEEKGLLTQMAEAIKQERQKMMSKLKKAV
ncbi:MAG: hypothetical protein QXY62_05845 [Candidatus Altiarchaeota archaeon]